MNYTESEPPQETNPVNATPQPAPAPQIGTIDPIMVINQPTPQIDTLDPVVVVQPSYSSAEQYKLDPANFHPPTEPNPPVALYRSEASNADLLRPQGNLGERENQLMTSQTANSDQACRISDLQRANALARAITSAVRY